MSCPAQVLQYQVADTFANNWGGIYHARIDNDGNVISVYQSHWAGDEPMSTLLKTDKRGNIIWGKHTYGLVSSIELGDSSTYIGLGMGQRHPAYIVTPEDTGAINGWEAGFTPYSLNVQRNGLVITGSDALICGNNGFNSSTPQIDGYIFKANYSTRQLLWAKRYYSTTYMQHVYFNGIAETSNGIYITGGTRYADAEIIYKIDSTGNSISSYRLDSTLTIDTVKFKYRYFDKIRNVGGHLFVTCRFKDTNRTEKHEAYFIGRYDTSTNSITGKVFYTEGLAKFDIPAICFVDTNLYYLAFRLSEYDAVISRIQNDSVVYAKNFRAIQPLRFCSLDYQDDTVIVTGNYGAKAYYACFNDSVMQHYTEKSDDTTMCQVSDTMIFSKNATFYLKAGLPIYTANVGGLSQVWLDKRSAAVHTLTRICFLEDTTTKMYDVKKGFKTTEIYPNPCRGVFFVAWHGRDEMNSIKVINIIGQNMEIDILEKANGVLEIKLPVGISSGVYFCIVQSKFDKVIKKLIVE